GLCWLFYVAAQEVEQRAVRRQLRIFAGGVVLLASVAVVLYLTQRTLPFWNNERGFGPFPDRDQTADLLGITAVVILACGQDDLRQKRKQWLFWFFGLAIIIAAIVLNSSRAGVLLLLVGSLLWLGFFVLRSGSTTRIVIGATVLLVLLALLLLFGGQTLERFGLHAGAGANLPSEVRWLVFQDALELIRASPWCGIGLGNFQPVFAMFRNASLGQARALHPESDWLWLTAEIGWLGVALVVAGAVVLGWRVFPFGEGTNQRFRVAALIAGLLFALHGFVDVSGHRIGTAFVGIFLFGLALRRPRGLRTSGTIPIVFRAAGAVLLLIGLTWTVAAQRRWEMPGGIGVENEKQRAAAANVGRNYEETIARATRALDWAPLDWQLYFLRALGKVGAEHSASEALADFRRARFLEPNSFDVPYQEGLAWITREPSLAATAWGEALRRAGPQRPELYGRMLASSLDPALSLKLEELGTLHPDLALIFFERASQESFPLAMRRLLEHDGSLENFAPAEKSRLFELWAERGDVAQLISAIESLPGWLPLAWRGMAKARAAEGNFNAAIELVRQFGEKPAVPAVRGGASLEQLEKALSVAPNDYATGFELYQRQTEDGRLDDALVTLRRFTTQAGAPSYFHFLEAETWAAKENWERAWAAWQQFDTAGKKRS
ncbi:MAG: O-antigen ligase family protein, partial [Chthoniobacterales bacterium]|nr:O-antigen ligase family protein [Chthoniobacterales bacterium]